MSAFDISPTPLAGLMLAARKRHVDERGYFSRLFCEQELAQMGWRHRIAQINHSLTHQKGTVRGLHYQQPPHAEDKYVTCLRGAIFDVAVDLRQGSPTFLHWHGQCLSAENGCAMLIPQGFAHGFQALEEGTELLYLHSQPYAPQAEAGLHPGDARLAIAWPLPIAQLSPRDAGHAFLSSNFIGLRYDL
jgi:dTDP-4-dehydrorhamnose 3,5-epimerase